MRRAPESTRFALAVFGCRSNQEEIEAIRSHLIALGLQETAFPGPAELVIVNTCAVTSSAMGQSRRAIRRAARQGGGDSWILATGCGAQLDPRSLAALPAVGLVAGNGEKTLLPRFLAALAEGPFPPGRRRVAAALDAAGLHPREETAGAWICRNGEAAGSGFLSRADGVQSARTRVSLKIQDGCDRTCSYCVVSRLRGRPRSRPPGEVVGEVQRLTAAGHREIVLTGINLGLYGQDWEGADPAPGAGLAALLDRLGAISDLGRVRLSSLEPDTLGAGLIDRLAEADWICPHLHLALQSGHADVLQRMKRSYSPGDALRIVDRLRRARPTFGIGVDVLAGFPGETDEAFRTTLSFVEGLPATYLHAFAYSERPGTEARELPGQIPLPARRERVRLLRALDVRLRTRFQARLAGRRCRLLVERSTSAGFEGVAGEYVRMRGGERGPDCGALIDVVAGEPLSPSLQSCRVVAADPGQDAKHVPLLSS
ncbi:MAG: tRNA (N(6)-L-threonylcarbamoyladenosine(37)-C(2))-methylthiotransferase MtaB [Candidatus Eisenbacteria bacterium]